MPQRGGRLVLRSQNDIGYDGNVKSEPKSVIIRPTTLPTNSKNIPHGENLSLIPKCCVFQIHISSLSIFDNQSSNYNSQSSNSTNLPSHSSEITARLSFQLLINGKQIRFRSRDIDYLRFGNSNTVSITINFYLNPEHLAGNNNPCPILLIQLHRRKLFEQFNKNGQFNKMLGFKLVGMTVLKVKLQNNDDGNENGDENYSEKGDENSKNHGVIRNDLIETELIHPDSAKSQMRAQKLNLKNQSLTQDQKFKTESVVEPLVSAAFRRNSTISENSVKTETQSVITGRILWRLTTKHIEGEETAGSPDSHPKLCNKYISNSCPTSPTHRVVMPLQVVGETSSTLHGTDGHSRNAEKSGILENRLLENSTLKSVANQRLEKCNLENKSDDRLQRGGVCFSSLGIEKNKTFLEHKTENKTVSVSHECIDDKLALEIENETNKTRTSLDSLEDIKQQEEQPNWFNKNNTHGLSGDMNQTDGEPTTESVLSAQGQSRMVQPVEEVNNERAVKQRMVNEVCGTQSRCNNSRVRLSRKRQSNSTGSYLLERAEEVVSMNAAHQSNRHASGLDATLKSELSVNNAEEPEVSTTDSVPEQTTVSLDVTNDSVIIKQEPLSLNTDSISVTLPQVHSRISAPSIQLDGLSITQPPHLLFNSHNVPEPPVINHQVYDIYDDLTENTQLSRLVRALQINKRTFKDRVNNTHMNMKHKLNGIRENNNNKAKTGPKILKDRVMSVVTRMRNTNFTIIRESPNNDSVSPENDGDSDNQNCSLPNSVPNMLPKLSGSATCGNLHSYENTMNYNLEKRTKKKLKTKREKKRTLEKQTEKQSGKQSEKLSEKNSEKTNHSNSPMRSIFSKNSKKEQNLEHRPKEPDQQSMRTCSSVANLDRLYDELDLLDDYDYEGEVSNKSARSSHRHSFSGGVSPYRKQINSESFHQDIVQKAVKKSNQLNLEAELSKNSKNNNVFSDETNPETSNPHESFPKHMIERNRSISKSSLDFNNGEISDFSEASDTNDNSTAKVSNKFKRSSVKSMQNSVKNSLKNSIKITSKIHDITSSKNSKNSKNSKHTKTCQKTQQESKENHHSLKNSKNPLLSLSSKTVNNSHKNNHSHQSTDNNFKPIIITPPPDDIKQSRLAENQTTVSSNFTAGNCPSDIVETKSISSLISRNSFRPSGENGNGKGESTGGQSSVLFTPFFERNDN